MDIHEKSVDMDMYMDGKFHIHGKPVLFSAFQCFFCIGVCRPIFLTGQQRSIMHYNVLTPFKDFRLFLRIWYS